MPLQEQLDARNAANRERLPAATTAAMDADVDAVSASGLAGAALDVGGVLPSFTLRDEQGVEVTREDLLAHAPVVLSFYRGGWCPYCNLQFAALAVALPAIEEQGARLVAVSPQTPDASLTTRERNELPFSVLSDVGNVLARKLGLVHRLSDDVKALYDGWGFDTDGANDGHGDELPLPATFVVDGDGVVRWRFVDADYRRRAEPDDVVAALREL